MFASFIYALCSQPSRNLSLSFLSLFLFLREIPGQSLKYVGVPLLQYKTPVILSWDFKVNVLPSGI